MRSFIKSIAGIAVLFSMSASVVRGASVTVITHGFQLLDSSLPGWVPSMAGQIPGYHQFHGATFSTYKMTITYNGGSGSYEANVTRVDGDSPMVTDSGEIIVELNWASLSGDVFSSSASTKNVGVAVGAFLARTNLIPELNGHALVEFPIHLIGHSRGGSLVSKVASQLGADGIWVDHLTTLDPYPINNDGNSNFPATVSDASVKIYWNVLFADDYWQNLGLGYFLGQPNGESVSGAYNRQLKNLSGGYDNPHSDVHLWYHGTINLDSPISDSDADITSSERTNWWVIPYEQAGLKAGYKWSLIGGGDRTSIESPEGFGKPMIREGLNQIWDFGAGIAPNRAALPSNNGSWPNVIKLNILGTNIVDMGAVITNKYFFQFGQSASASATVQLFLDVDSNPLNGDSGLVYEQVEMGTGTNVIRTRTTFFNATNLPGQYYLFAKVTGNNHTRYLYTPEKLTIADRTPPLVSITNAPKTYTNSQVVVIGAAGSDNVGVTSVEFYDGMTLKATDAVAPYTYDWSFTGADNGAHVWTARAYDAGGNSKTSSPVTLTVSIDITPPTVAISNPTNGASLTNSSTMVSGTADDLGSPTSGLSLVEVRVNGGSWQTATGTANWSRSVTLTPCENTIEARSLDKAGNYSTNALISVTYIAPNTPPNTPTNISPSIAAMGVSITPTLQAGGFSDVDCVGDTHTASQWQVLNGAGTVIIADSGADTFNKAAWTVPANKLYYGSNYVWKVRYQDSRGGWSSYSAQTAFTTIGPVLNQTTQGSNIILLWPTNAFGFSLQWITDVSQMTWSNSMPAPSIVNGQYTITNSMTNSVRFYRLMK